MMRQVVLGFGWQRRSESDDRPPSITARGSAAAQAGTKERLRILEVVIVLKNGRARIRADQERRIEGWSPEAAARRGRKSRVGCCRAIAWVVAGSGAEALGARECVPRPGTIGQQKASWQLHLYDSCPAFPKSGSQPPRRSRRKFIAAKSSAQGYDHLDPRNKNLGRRSNRWACHLQDFKERCRMKVPPLAALLPLLASPARRAEGRTRPCPWRSGHSDVRDLAEATGLHRNTITNLEVGRYGGDPKSLELIELVLKKPASAVRTRRGSRQNHWTYPRRIAFANKSRASPPFAELRRGG